LELAACRRGRARGAGVDCQRGDPGEWRWSRQQRPPHLRRMQQHTSPLPGAKEETKTWSRTKCAWCFLRRKSPSQANQHSTPFSSPNAREASLFHRGVRVGTLTVGALPLGPVFDWISKKLARFFWNVAERCPQPVARRRRWLLPTLHRCCVWHFASPSPVPLSPVCLCVPPNWYDDSPSLMPSRRRHHFLCCRTRNISPRPAA
jgi:hypothetical protein